jgi:DNA-binding transcriptional MerR regulator/methylmalonyl-CoA mutase cobalamin-binding subunit
MYTIKQAAARTGLSVALIRVWERRYGVVEPGRTAAGYRLYDDEAIRRLAAMRALVAGGWAPRQAAERLRDPGSDLGAVPGNGRSNPRPIAAASRPVDRFGAAPTLPPGQDHGARDLALVADLVSAARELDVPAMERILDESFAAQRFELAIEDIVSPALRAIGSSWAEGTIDVAAEHAASETIRRRLARFFDAGGVGERIPTVIVGLPPDGYHEIGAFAFAVAARRAGLDVLYLGANVPVSSWVHTVLDTRAPVVVLGIVAPADIESAAEVIEALRGIEPPPACLVGGPFSVDAPETSDTVRLPVQLDAAVAAVVEILESGSPSSPG